MIKLLNAYRTDPSDKNAVKLAVYEGKHPMAKCFLSADDALDLKKALEQTEKKKIVLANQKTGE